LEEGPKQVIRALTSSERRAARTGAEIYAGEQLVGTVTSGQPSPTLGHPIALALVATAANLDGGAAVEVDIRGKRFRYNVHETAALRQGRTPPNCHPRACTPPPAHSRDNQNRQLTFAPHGRPATSPRPDRLVECVCFHTSSHPQVIKLPIGWTSTLS